MKTIAVVQHEICEFWKRIFLVTHLLKADRVESSSSSNVSLSAYLWSSRFEDLLKFANAQSQTMLCGCV